MFVTFSSYRRCTSDDEGRSRPGERSSQNSAVAQTQLKIEPMSKACQLRTEHTAGPNSSTAQEGSDISSGGSGTLVIPAFRRATSQTDRDLRDIKTCRRALLVRARFTRSIGPSSENTWGVVACSGTDGNTMFRRNGRTENRTSKGNDSMFCSRPRTLRLNPVLFAFAGDFDDEVFPALSSLRRLAAGCLTVCAVSTERVVIGGVGHTSKINIRFSVITLPVVRISFVSTRPVLITH